MTLYIALWLSNSSSAIAPTYVKFAVKLARMQDYDSPVIFLQFNETGQLQTEKHTVAW